MKGAEGHTGTEGWMDGKMAEWLVMSQCALSGAWCYGCVPVCVCAHGGLVLICVCLDTKPLTIISGTCCAPPSHLPIMAAPTRSRRVQCCFLGSYHLPGTSRKDRSHT